MGFFVEVVVIKYPWGSGGKWGESGSNTVAERSQSFADSVSILRKQGLNDTEIARGFGMTSTEFRDTVTIAKNARQAANVAMAQSLKDKGYSNVKGAERMGIPEATYRDLLKRGLKDTADVLAATSSMLKERVDKVKFLDIGSGQEAHIGISSTKLRTAVAVLKDQGYSVHSVKLPQLGTDKMTEYKILVPPGITQKDVWLNRHNIQQLTDFSEDGGRTFLGIQPPLSISSKRVGINYAEDGGKAADGVIYVRPGVPDVSLGRSRYAQVRIAVDGTHYIKGMAMYKDDLPDGVDLVFNTNKSKEGTNSKLDVFKEMKKDSDGNIDPDNPFGSSISRQLIVKDSRGKDKVTSVMNIVNEEGDWETWSRSLSSQMLSKQSPKLAKSQLDLTYENKKNEFDNIMKLTNPAVKRKLLESLADDADSSAWQLKAHALPRQSSHVILPMTSIKETEIYAPTFRNGERVVLIRHPHGGIFEIPELVVNNKLREGKNLLGDTQDAVGIHPKVAEKLSGADFDGDSVVVIPNNSGLVKTKPSLRGLQDFDPHREYPPYDGMRTIDGGTYNEKTKEVEYHGKAPSGAMQNHMGDISNLITDMTIKHASDDELARAVRHSMVIIDAEKHHLDYKLSAIKNGIPSLKEKYQGGKRAGASTLISKKKQDIQVPERKQGYRIDPVTGKKIFRETGATYVNRRGELVRKTEPVKKILEVSDVNSLSSGTPIEKLYADHSNRLKSLADQARLESTKIKTIPYSPSAKTHYQNEVASLNSKLHLAIRNRPLERQAQVIGNRILAMKKAANPDMDKVSEKKIKNQALNEARTRTGANSKGVQIDITPKEWDAIQAGAISNHQLTEILKKTDLDVVKQYATPKPKLLMTSTKQAAAQSMLANGYTQQEVADHLGVSLTTLKTSLRGG